MTEAWYYNWQGQQTGPVSAEQLQQLVAGGRLPPDQLVWKEGLPNWLPAAAVPGLLTPAVLAAGLPPAPLAAGYAPGGQADYGAPPNNMRDRPRRPRRKKKRKTEGMPPAVKIGLITGGTILGVALLLILVLFVVVPIFDPANARTSSGSYSIALHPNEADTTSVEFKKGQEVTLKVINQGSLGQFHVMVLDPNNSPVNIRGKNNGFHATVNFDVNQTGSYTIDIRNIGFGEGGAVVSYTAR